MYIFLLEYKYYDHVFNEYFFMSLDIKNLRIQNYSIRFMINNINKLTFVGPKIREVQINKVFASLTKYLTKDVYFKNLVVLFE